MLCFTFHKYNQIPPKVLRPKQPEKKSSKKTNGQIRPESKREKKNLDIDIGKTKFDLSGVPSPFWSCTGMPRVCYKWGAGGWQSLCCTNSISEHPLPIEFMRPGVRMATRKMSNGAYVKLILKLSAEGYDLSHHLDLKDHWARHGTNKFVTIEKRSGMLEAKLPAYLIPNLPRVSRGVLLYQKEILISSTFSF